MGLLVFLTKEAVIRSDEWKTSLLFLKYRNVFIEVVIYKSRRCIAQNAV